jgi:predicted nucleotidyltransferase
MINVEITGSLSHVESGMSYRFHTCPKGRGFRLESAVTSPLIKMLTIIDSMCPQSDRSDIEINVDALVATLEEYPVRYAVLYGSYAHGVATSDSDIDIAVAFVEELSDAERFDCRIELVVDLMEALGRDDIDLADLNTIRPEVGLQALETGLTLIDNQEAHEEYRDQFEREASSVGTHEERMQQFDAILTRLEKTI